MTRLQQILSICCNLNSQCDDVVSEDFVCNACFDLRLLITWISLAVQKRNVLTLLELLIRFSLTKERVQST